MTISAPARSPSCAVPVLQMVIDRLMKMRTRHGVRIEAQGQIYLAEPQTDGHEGRGLRDDVDGRPCLRPVMESAGPAAARIVAPRKCRRRRHCRWGASGRS